MNIIIWPLAQTVFHDTEPVLQRKKLWISRRVLEVSSNDIQHSICKLQYIKIQPETIDLSMMLQGINPTNSVVIPRSLVLRSIILGWILTYRNQSILSSLACVMKNVCPCSCVCTWTWMFFHSTFLGRFKTLSLSNWAVLLKEKEKNYLEALASLYWGKCCPWPWSGPHSKPRAKFLSLWSWQITYTYWSEFINIHSFS